MRRGEKTKVHAFLLTSFPLRIIGLFPTAEIAEMCAVDVRKKSDVASTVIFVVPLEYVNSWKLIINFILYNIYCDVCGGIETCHCSMLGLKDYYVTVKLKEEKCVLKKDV